MRRKSSLRSASPIPPGALPGPASLDAPQGSQQDEKTDVREREGCTRVTGTANSATPKETMRRATDCGPAPDTRDSAKSGLSLPRIETLGFQDGAMAVTSHVAAMSGTKSPRCASAGAHPGRRQSVPALAAAARSLHFHRFCEGLRRHGAREFGNIGPAGVFVMPLELRRPSAAISEESQQEASSPIPESGRLPIRVVIRPKDRSPVVLKREFDLSELRATVPEALPSPRSPNFDRGALLAAAAAEGAVPLPRSPASASRSGRGSVDMGSSEPPPSPLSERKHCAGPHPVAMHLPYARAFLPVLAAVMMSEQVRGGDRIDVPMPHPRAWTETVAFVYTGEEELLTEQVKLNILYLGGKV
ncbi:Uncharacterized protein TCAP_00910 [Tolypocladium capitatum]|uniref:Uncharacterized protein n=1 Tax=Tolypocladium capitatum TaxID=45235 RepID=A0A2K3QNQ8_9HYPO|nr:Uncharacterized protein TCAP_00910 [Tolypocladium capitatum]